jgi:hypothetical protein
MVIQGEMMKKILLIVSAAAFLFAARYPIVAEYSYMKGCTSNKEALIDYCACTLGAIEEKYTLNEFISMAQDKNKFKDVIKYAVNKCIDKLDMDKINK